jgi:hypothetical protein
MWMVDGVAPVLSCSRCPATTNRSCSPCSPCSTASQRITSQHGRRRRYRHRTSSLAAYILPPPCPSLLYPPTGSNTSQALPRSHQRPVLRAIIHVCHSLSFSVWTAVDPVSLTMVDVLPDTTVGPLPSCSWLYNADNRGSIRLSCSTFLNVSLTSQIVWIGGRTSWLTNAHHTGNYPR